MPRNSQHGVEHVAIRNVAPAKLVLDHRAAPSGGALDLDANAACGSNMGVNTEHVYWPRGMAPAGTYTVYVRPELVVEIAFNDLQKSPHYPGGLALRFARLKAYREDKRADEADTIETVREIYRRKTGDALEEASRQLELF